jgi:hypothetical protein
MARMNRQEQKLYLCLMKINYEKKFERQITIVVGRLLKPVFEFSLIKLHAARMFLFS